MIDREGTAEADPWAAASLVELTDLVNERYDDVLELLVRGHSGHEHVTGAWLTEVAPDAMGITARLSSGKVRVSVAFPEPLRVPENLYEVLAKMVEQARSSVPNAPLTNFERAGEGLKRIRTFLANVVEVTEVHPHLREITVGGDDLARFEPLGPDTFLYVLLPPPDRNELTIGRDFSWDTVADMPVAEQPGGAYYTLRRWDPDRQRLTMHLVLHGDGGSGSAWARRAKVGNPVALWGPRTAFAPPTDTDWLLLIADETGLPATAAILEHLPAGRRAVVFAEVANAGERQELPTSPSIEVTWLHRDGAPPGTTTLLAEAVRSLQWPGGHPYAWGGAESRAVTAVRKYLRNDVGLPHASVSMTGYWRHSTGDD